MKKRNYPSNRRQYDAEFKKNALQLITDGRSVSSVAQSLGVSEGVLYNWKSKAKKEALIKPQSEDKAEIEALKKKLAEAEMERDILKKALGIFSRKR